MSQLIFYITTSMRFKATFYSVFLNELYGGNIQGGGLNLKGGEVELNDP